MPAPAIAKIRQALAASGISVGSGTGYDDAQAAAVSIYQRQHGLKIDGKVGSETAPNVLLSLEAVMDLGFGVIHSVLDEHLPQAVPV